jgi:hypothetical protein
MSKVRQVASFDIDLENDVEDCTEQACEVATPSVRRVQIKQLPFLDTFYGHHTLCVTIDSGAETNMMRNSVARYFGATITNNTQVVYQVDGRSPLTVCGETRVTLSRDGRQFVLEALVIEDMDVDILAGVPFMDTNDIYLRPARRQVILGDGTTYVYGPGPKDNTNNSPTVRRAQSCVLHAPSSATTICPGEFIELDVPDSFTCDQPLALEPRTDTNTYPAKPSQLWPQPDVIKSVDGKVRISNNTTEPKVLRRNIHFCQVSSVVYPEEQDASPTCTEPDSIPISTGQPASVREVVHKPVNTHSYSDNVQLDPDNILPPDIKQQFQTLHTRYDEVFSTEFSGYNGAVGPFEAVVNMGPVQPPQGKGRVPQYARDKLVELQHKFDELETTRVFKRPEDVGIQASPHRIATLSTCDHPSTVKGMRSFVGAYKVLARVIPNCDDILSSLDDVSAGRSSQDKIEWNDDLRHTFANAPKLLSSNKSGMSSREMITQHDQFTNIQIPVCDRQLIIEQHQARVQNHPYSAKAKAPFQKPASRVSVEVGDLVYLHNDRSKLHARDRYLVVSFEGDRCNIRKFTGSQLRSSSYRVKLVECHAVTGEQTSASPFRRRRNSDASDDEVEGTSPTSPLLDLSYIPYVLSTPANDDIPVQVDFSETKFSV